MATVEYFLVAEIPSDMEANLVSPTAYAELTKHLGPAAQLIAFKCSDGYVVPKFQLDGRGAVRTTVAHINYILRANAQPANTLKVWQRSSIHLGGRAAIDMITELSARDLITFARRHMV